MGGAELMGRAVRSAKSNRDVELSAGHGEHVRRVVHDLIERDERKAEGHKLDDRPQPYHRGADAQPGKSVLTDRRIADPLRSVAFQQSTAHFASSIVFR